MGRPRKHIAAIGSIEVMANADEAGTRAQLCFAINRILDERKMTQMEAARVMGVHQPTVSLLKGYQLKKFSVERLLRLIAMLGQDVVIEIRPRADEGAGRVKVIGAVIQA
jgi:predicted XRE-type DNA-binding protein